MRTRNDEVNRKSPAARPFAIAPPTRAVVSALLALVLVAPVRAQDAGTPLRVVATVPDLGDLANEVGGSDVSVSVLATGRQDAHFVDPRPSFVRLLNQADALLLVGLDLEAGYLPPLLRSARNQRILPGAPGYVDASAAIAPLGVPGSMVDRSMGDVHPFGNPHYLLDPVNGVKVAELVRNALQRLRPEKRDSFESRYQDFRRRLGAALVGDTLAQKYDAFKLALLQERGGLESFLQQQGDADALGGWLGRTKPYRGARVVDDHNLWPYFAKRFGIEVVGDMEPRPGIPPTTKHLQELIELMKARKVVGILAAPYYDPRHARFLADATGARIAELTHQVGGRDRTATYLTSTDYNVRKLVEALGETGR